MTRLACYALATALTGLVTCGSASAQTPPASVVGTWTGFANQTEVRLIVRAQGTTGACPVITGVMTNVPAGGSSTVQGFYCPTTGRISYIRKDTQNNDTFQSYLASLSEVGSTLRMAGTFSELSQVGHTREFNFAVERKVPQ